MRHIGLFVMLLAMACGGPGTTGSVTGVALTDGQVVAVVRMDDGREVHALMPESDGSTTLVGGQRVQLEPTESSSLWRVVRILDAEIQGELASPEKTLDVAVVGMTRQQQWDPPDRAPGIVIVRGASLKLIDGAMSGFEAEPGYDIAIVNLEIAINSVDVSLPMERAVALDAAGNEYASLADPQPLAQGAGQLREFGFAVPTGTDLESLRLANGLTLELTSP